MGRLAAFAALGLTVTVTVVAAAQAGPPGKWTKVTGSNQWNIDEVGAARTGDGVLHVVWLAREGASPSGIRHTPVSPSGAVGATSTVASGFDVANPDLVVVAGGGLQALFGGILYPDPLSGIQSSTAGADGASWSGPSKVSDSRGAAGTAGAAFVPGLGVTAFAWASGTRLYAHLGGPGPDIDLSGPSCCYYDPGVAVDEATGEVWVAWYSNATGQFGTFVRTISPGVGAPALAPGSAEKGESISPDERTAIASRAGGGVFVAYCGGYPTCKRALLWRIGTGKPLVAGAGGDVENVNVVSGPEGRLWIFWADEDLDRIYAARTNKAATRIGARVAVKYPLGGDTIWKLEGDGALGRLDVLANTGDSGKAATWHTQVLPGLSLSCKGGKVVSCTVTDAGDPVAGAKVKVGGKTLTTNAQGKASADLPAGSFTAVASRAGYTGASAKVKSA